MGNPDYDTVSTVSGVRKMCYVWDKISFVCYAQTLYIGTTLLFGNMSFSSEF